MNSPSEAHPFSAFALDLYWASKKAGDPAIKEHVNACARCAAYLQHLDAVGARPPAAWNAEAPLRPLPRSSSHRARRGRAFAWASAAAGGLAIAAAALVIVRSRATTDDAYVGVKGTPAVQVIVRRDGRTQIWDGREPVRPRDALALRVGCEGFAHVTVATPAPVGGTWMRLADHACPRDSNPLPFTLTVDDQPGEERLVVVLSEAPLDDRALATAAAGTRRGSGVWAVPLVFPKEVGLR